MMTGIWILVASLVIGIPALLAGWQKESNWGVVWVSTIFTPFIVLTGVKIYAKLYWQFSSTPGSGCSGGECGGGAYAAGYWPLLIPVLMVVSFVVSGFVVLVRNSRTS